VNSRISSLTVAIVVFYAVAFAASALLYRLLPSVEILVSIPVFGFALLWAYLHPNKGS
jgi:hypothetical protein